MGETPSAHLSIRRAGRLRRNFTLLGGLAATLCASLLLFWQQTAASTPSPLLVLGLVGSVMSAVGLVYTVRANPMRQVSWATLSVDAGGLRLDGRRLLLRSELLRGFVLRAKATLAPPADDGDAKREMASAEVHLERRWPRPPIDLLVTEEQGRALLRHLGVDASQTVATFVVSSILRGRPWTGLTTWMLAGAALFVPMLLAVSPRPLALVATLATWALLAAWSLALALPSRLVVGTDGVVLSWLFQKRFIPYERVQGIRSLVGRARGVSLVLDDEGPLNLPVRRAISTDVEERNTDFMLERMSQALHEHRAGMIGGVAEGGLPERGGRDAEVWVRALRRAGSGGSDDHRTPAIRKDVLWRVVEDPAASAGDRATAAVALSATLDDQTKQRIRIAAEATAAPEMRAVLEAVAAEADEAELARTVRRLE